MDPVHEIRDYLRRLERYALKFGEWARRDSAEIVKEGPSKGRSIMSVYVDGDASAHASPTVTVEIRREQAHGYMRPHAAPTERLEETAKLLILATEDLRTKKRVVDSDTVDRLWAFHNRHLGGVDLEEN